MTKLIIAGGRDYGRRFNEDGSLDLEWEIDCWNQFVHCMNHMTMRFKAPFTLISGGAKGADNFAEEWAEQGFIPIQVFEADWKKYGKGAGYVRNEEMAIEGDVLAAFWDGKSRGTKHMIDLALKHGLEVHIYRYNKE
jgi:hypothetical protein